MNNSPENEHENQNSNSPISLFIISPSSRNENYNNHFSDIIENHKKYYDLNVTNNNNVINKKDDSTDSLLNTNNKNQHQTKVQTIEDTVKKCRKTTLHPKADQSYKRKPFLISGYSHLDWIKFVASTDSFSFFRLKNENQKND
jgi:hypothetical protein